MYPLLDSITLAPPTQPSGEVERGFSRLHAYVAAHAEGTGSAELAELLVHPKVRELLTFVFTYSPFLTRLILLHPLYFAQWCRRGSDSLFSELKTDIQEHAYGSVGEVMKTLRVAKGKVALIIALADIAGFWPLEMVTAAMSDFAENATQIALRFLLSQAHQKQEMQLPYPHTPERESGFFVLAMGKMGARELNYSSDIDLIVLFDRELAVKAGCENPQMFFPKLTRELARILQERTADGYVFRVDLRLRPDPASTPVALSTAGAITYYETVGQNWERAAMIKARPVAGDMEAAFLFLKQITPFIWRKHLDFAAIADIQSIKRQMDARVNSIIDLAGHNIKTGLGGIREIEFFAQIHQLIWGGRVVELRLNGTCRTLEALAEAGRISTELATRLIESYRLFRTIEHRLQMIDDQQTHSLPTTPEALAQLARFCGFGSYEEFETTLMPHLQAVHENFSRSFNGQGSLSNEAGTLSFTGVENNPETVETIRKMGFSNPESISEVIQGWHRGTRRATRTKRARELITELTPSLLKALAATTHPEQAFTHFDTFLARLPAGIQIFSLFQANPHLLDHIAIIMGSAPAMAESLSKNPALLDTILTADFFKEFPARDELFNELANALLLTRDFEDEMDAVRRFKNEKQFQAGVQLLYRKVSADETRHYLSDVAEVCVSALLHRVEIDFAARNGVTQVGSLAVIALGRLGARDLTFGSDVDMVFLYPTPAEGSEDQGQHYNKLCKRFITALSALTPQGRLYEVDTRLRPSGKDGALAVSVAAFDKYFAELAWTFELMALTRARVLSGTTEMRDTVTRMIFNHLTRPRDIPRIAADVLDIRNRVDKEFGTKNPWNLKYVRGGLMDLDFLSQYFILCHAAIHPGIIHPSAGDVFRYMQERKLLEDAVAQTLIDAHTFLNSLFTLLRLCGGSELDEVTAVPGLKAMIAGSMKMPHFGEVRLKLHATLAEVQQQFKAFLNT